VAPPFTAAAALAGFDPLQDFAHHTGVDYAALGTILPDIMRCGAHFLLGRTI